MKRSGVRILSQTFVLSILFTSVAMVNVALGDFKVISGTQDLGDGKTQIIWAVKVSNNQSFKDFHVITDDGNSANYVDYERPTGWSAGIATAGDGKKWISFYGSTEQSADFTFKVTYKGTNKIKGAARWRITNDGNESPDDGIDTSGSNAHSPTAAIPTLTEWGMIIFGVVLLGFITWVFLRRRRTAISLQ